MDQSIRGTFYLILKKEALFHSATSKRFGALMSRVLIALRACVLKRTSSALLQLNTNLLLQLPGTDSVICMENEPTVETSCSNIISIQDTYNNPALCADMPNLATLFF